MKFFTTLIVLAVIGLGVFFLATNSSGNIKSNIISGDSVNEDILENVKVFTVTGDHLRFWINGEENPDIVVSKGDTVRINFQSTEGFHDWVLDGFEVSTNKVTGEETSFVEFVATERGTFEYYCSVGQHRANGMFGRFIVR